MPFPTGIVDALDPAPPPLLGGGQRPGLISRAPRGRGGSQPPATQQLETPAAAHGSRSWVADRVGKREFSLGIAGEVELPDGVRAEPFLDDELVAISAPGRVKLRRGKASVEDLGRWTLLVREPGSSTRAVAERYLA